MTISHRSSGYYSLMFIIICAKYLFKTSGKFLPWSEQIANQRVLLHGDAWWWFVCLETINHANLF